VKIHCICHARDWLVFNCFKDFSCYDGRVKNDLLLKKKIVLGGLCPPPPPFLPTEMLLDRGCGRGQSLKLSWFESEEERESLCKLSVGLGPVKGSRCEREKWLKT
jgi:hypothetical protein